MRECWNGRQARLRCVWFRRVGSSPISRTKKNTTLWVVFFLVYSERWDSKGVFFLILCGKSNNSDFFLDKGIFSL